jgi:hypothetical protein
MQLYDVITDLPFDLYSVFVIEERFGFNKQTLGVRTNNLILVMLG